MEPAHFTARYHRQLQLPGFGIAAQRRLSLARVLVVGAGGLGVPALQYLAGMGAGTIGIVDDDVVSLSNLHRQVLYTVNDIGRSKAKLAAAKLRSQNPDIDIKPHPLKLVPGNALELIGNYDIVVDATDNFAARYLINDACVILGKAFVYGAVHQYEGHVSLFNHDGGPTYRCLYPKAPAAGQVPDCSVAGVLGVVPGIIGCRQALEVVKVVTGIGKTLSGCLQVYDFLNDGQQTIKLKLSPDNCRITVLQESYEIPPCAAPGAKISPQILLEWYQQQRQFTLLDVRESAEYNSACLPEAQHAPLAGLKAITASIDTTIPLVVYCQRGIRSAEAADILREHIPTLEVFELAGGMDNWLNHVSEK